MMTTNYQYLDYKELAKAVYFGKSNILVYKLCRKLVNPNINRKSCFCLAVIEDIQYKIIQPLFLKHVCRQFAFFHFCTEKFMLRNTLAHLMHRAFTQLWFVHGSSKCCIMNRASPNCGVCMGVTSITNITFTKIWCMCGWDQLQMALCFRAFTKLWHTHGWKQYRWCME